MASKNPIGRLADTAIKSLKDPVGTAGKVVDQAKGGAALGRSVVEHVGRSAFTKATETAGAVMGRATGHAAASSGRDEAAAPLRPVPDVNEPAHTAEPGTPPGDLSAAKKAAARKTAKKVPAKKTAKKTAKSAASPADVAKTVEAAVAEDPSKTAATPAGAGAPGDKLPAKKAAGKKAAGKKAAAKKAPATTTAAEQSPANKTAAKKPAKKSPAKKARPKTAEQVAGVQGDDVMTPVGTPAADRASNPDTTEHDLNQPDTEGIVEPSTAKAVSSRAETLRKAAEKNPED